MRSDFTLEDAKAAVDVLRKHAIPPFECRSCGEKFYVLVVDGRDSLEVGCPCCNSKYTLARDQRLGKRVAIRVKT